MKIGIRLVLLAAAAGLGFWLWTVFFPSPEKVVLKRVANLAAAANIGAGDSNIVRAGKASNVVGAFSNDAEIALDVTGAGARTLSGREEIREAALGTFTSVPALKVQFFDARATVAADKQSAEVSCTAQVSAGDSRDFGIQELHFQFKKIDGDFLITRVETVKTLK